MSSCSNNKSSPPIQGEQVGTVGDMRSAGIPPPPPSQIESDTALLKAFISEAHAHLGAVKAHLLTLHTPPPDEAALKAVHLAFHTIRGAAAFLGLDDIGMLACEMECLLDEVCKGHLDPGTLIVDVSAEATDALERLLSNLQEALDKKLPLDADAELPRILSHIRAAAVA